MTHTFKEGLRLTLAGMIVALVLSGCHSKATDEQDAIFPKEGMLAVERQQAYLDWNTQIIVDVPIAGPGYLKVSINNFLNSKLCDQLNEHTESKQPDLKNYDGLYDIDDFSLSTIIDAYRDVCHITNYTPVHYAASMDIARHNREQEKDFTERLSYVYPDTTCISLILIAQTESFLTYGVERFSSYKDHPGGSELLCYTFRKQDGCLIDTILTWGNMEKLIYSLGDSDLITAFGRMTDGEFLNAGLTEDGLLVIDEGPADEYSVGKIAYKDVLPYLSKEAKELVISLNTDSVRNRNDWYMGTCVGEINTDDDERIRLMQREPLWYGFSGLHYCINDDIFDSDRDSVITLTAYTVENNNYKPLLIFDLRASKSNKAQSQWVKSARKKLADKGGYSSKIESKTPYEFCFDDDRNVLLIPYLNESLEQKYIPFMYNGRQFIITDVKDTKPQKEFFGKIALKNNDLLYLTGDAGEVCAYYLHDDIYIPANVFPWHSNIISYMRADEPCNTSNPNLEKWIAFSLSNKIYVAIVERTSKGGYGCFDRYDVYGFDGEKFVYEGSDGGFWLHPSIRKFGRLEYLGKSEHCIVRIDEMRSYNYRWSTDSDYELYEEAQRDTCRWRLSLWTHKNSMMDKPDVVINDNCSLYDFGNNEYDYEIVPINETGAKALRIYNKEGACIIDEEINDIIADFW